MWNMPGDIYSHGSSLIILCLGPFLLSSTTDSIITRRRKMKVKTNKRSKRPPPPPSSSQSQPYDSSEDQVGHLILIVWSQKAGKVPIFATQCLNCL